ncbi:hypothetical protein PHYBLDRAFT_163579 [Phycomyces blakesleeanus NRRL 1555(-)]|uniref:Uncharacterized protein n=1 Tax=Phycomyces blakesleeanus (strain ATCC 8743b / DSM 1359 / FGSC 10004 / NBRC 33097 / NRRL 1555) TaxID=763407 RepID=A0A167PSS6_PHYB8|nr:hypothetical protein PHYBLDRAFT_163579 [Phycomyces blakesleeanus NRRL 1555(-)]OAD78474.1 hypothetical protein PHYBLDRAFT_163579 [Phycomyces blakesleeanus NRRL 1555(-)]|eukprot:XP_018296514.1 hypothetical protein PHYBLDRAFT_163579 [Phycomyces blakesleeanus NRRL 1555(-)]
MPIQGRPIGAPHLVLVLQNLLWGHLTYTTSGGSAQHRDEGRLSIKKRSWHNALKPSASYSESWTPPELSQGPEDNTLISFHVKLILFKSNAHEVGSISHSLGFLNPSKLKIWSASLKKKKAKICSGQFTFTPAVQRASSLEYASTLVSSLIDFEAQEQDVEHRWAFPG